MSYSPTQDTFRIAEIDFCGTTLEDPIGGSVDVSMGWCKSRPGTRVSPAIAPDSFDMSCTAVTSKPFTPVSPTTPKADVTFTLECIDLSTVDLTCSGMRAGAFKARMSQKPHEFEQSAEYDAADDENVDPISVG
jgi:hypothetical protein